MLERGHIIHEAYDWDAIPENAPVISFCNEDFLAALPKILQRMRRTLNALWFTHWDATRPLSVRKNATWYTYGHNLTKNVTELYNTNGTIASAYDYTPYGAVTATGIDQPFQWSSEVHDSELELVYDNYRYYNPTDGRRLGRELLGETASMQLYSFSRNRMTNVFDYLGLNVYDINETNYDVRLHPEQKSNTNDFVKRADKSESPQYYGGPASNWLGMHNAVCMNMTSSYDDGRPGNINHYHHAVKSKDSTIFPNLKSGDHNERPYTNKDGSGSSHNYIGEKLDRRLIQRIQLWSTGQKIQKLK
ncbi:MAG: RHS repeat-associated core domain-containing protein [Akkermansia sp.]